jgi:Flp pilus assembly protein TadG
MKPKLLSRCCAQVRAFRGATSGVALMEFALVLPVLITMSLTGAELTNYITTKMRVSQLALQLADDAARMGSGSQLQAKTITETDINDLFTGAQLQSGELDLNTNGRIILSNLLPTANPNTAGTYKIGWQRCYGAKTAHLSGYGTYNTASGINMTGMGPAGRQVTAQDDNATMFVEVFYTYKPLVGLGTLAPTTTFTEIASMAVRDRRDLSDDSASGSTATHPQGIYKVAGVTASIC